MGKPSRVLIANRTIGSPPLPNPQGHMEIWTHFWSLNTIHTNVSHSRARLRFNSILNSKGLCLLDLKVLTRKMLPQIKGSLNTIKMPFLNKIFFYWLIDSFWLCWVFGAAHGLPLVAASGGYSSLWCAGFSLQWLLLLRGMDSRHMGFSSSGRWA